jgi:hypothetical protein
LLETSPFYIFHLATIIVAIFTAASIVAARSFAVISTIIAAATFCATRVYTATILCIRHNQLRLQTAFIVTAKI